MKNPTKETHVGKSESRTAQRTTACRNAAQPVAAAGGS
jgi:hypothetical protein